ncbi:VOC family protein, partial [Vibrio cholerae]|nr:VOC family protein [Vibrio cholerae]EKF9106636.1 VOC family protein [Vibrio cholerae]
MAKIIHTMIRVMDLERSIKFYQDVLELEIKDQYKF